MKRKYTRLSSAVAGLEFEHSVLLSSVVAEKTDVVVESFESVQDADNNDFFKVEFE